ncbi:MAG: hypothetical protein MUQ10_14545 [Anaerolineae bacterium]|nr:hypothetical protein [Anaerolineae bacterium]
MNKKRLLNVVLGVAGAGMILAGSVGIALAQGPTQPEAGQRLMRSQDGDCAICEMSEWQGANAGDSTRMGGWRGGMRGESLVDTLAGVTGLSLEEVLAELDAGKTLSEVAEANGVSADVVVEEHLAQRTADLAQAVVDGRFSQEQVDLMLAEMAENLAGHMTGSWSPGSAGAGSEFGDGTGLRSENGTGYGARGSGRGRGGSQALGEGERSESCR